VVLADIRCNTAAAVTTFAVCAAVAAVFTRPWRQPRVRSRLQRGGLALVLATLLTAAGCGGSGSSKSPTPTANRPTTPVRIQITAPTPNQVTPPDTTVTIQLIGGTVVQRTTGKLTPTEGHVHVSVDGKLVSMAYTTTQEIKGLSPGAHSVQAEFVAVDHAPFKNRPVAAVLFTVQASS
jgi:hypothetical protein